MKTICFILCFIVFISINPLSGQVVKIYPIPSYNVLVESSAIFQEMLPSNNKAKREIKVHIFPSHKSDSIPCFAEVTIYSLDHQTVLGPYTVNCGETLSVEIDEREWGVAVTSYNPVDVSVWIDTSSKLKERTESIIPSKEQEICNPD
jgi:hypothetical protein